MDRLIMKSLPAHALFVLVTSPVLCQDFGPPQVISTSADEAEYVHAADLDGDGDTDVMSASRADNKIAWYENFGGGNFGGEELISTEVDYAVCVHAADLDADGDADVLSVSYTDNEIAWYKNDGGGSFGTQQIITIAAAGPLSIHTADLDGDGDIDVLSASALGDSVDWYRNLGGGDFGNPDTNQNNIASSYNTATSVFAVDLDGDGDVDVIAGARDDDDVSWFENDGLGNFAKTNIGAPDGVMSVHATDIDGDGDADVLAASVYDDLITWYENRLNEATSDFGPEQVITTIASGALFVFARDLDGDGDADLLSASENDDKVAWYENRLNQTENDFGPQQVITTNAVDAECVGAWDLDGDGDADVVSASQYDDKIAWYENLMGPIDCNGNGVPDSDDIANGTSADCDSNGVPDECQIADDPSLDCDWNSVLDTCDLQADPSLDCDQDGQLDSCQITADPSLDCNGNGILDSCEVPYDSTVDCDGNGVIDVCEINDDPDLDCDGDRVLDSCQLFNDGSLDCDGDNVIDACQIAGDPSLDQNQNGILDSCECAFDNYCQAAWNTSGGPAVMGALGTASLAANDLTLTVSGAPLGQFGLFFYGGDEDFFFVGDGAICVKPPLNRVYPVILTDGGGMGSLALDLALPVLVPRSPRWASWLQLLQRPGRDVLSVADHRSRWRRREDSNPR
jgi:hypothetical protein